MSAVEASVAELPCRQASPVIMSYITSPAPCFRLPPLAVLCRFRKGIFFTRYGILCQPFGIEKVERIYTVPAEVSERIAHDDTGSKRGYSVGYGDTSDYHSADPYNSYGGVQSSGGVRDPGMYGGYSSAHSGSSRFNSLLRRKPYY